MRQIHIMHFLKWCTAKSEDDNKLFDTFPIGRCGLCPLPLNQGKLCDCSDKWNALTVSDYSTLFVLQHLLLECSQAPCYEKLMSHRKLAYKSSHPVLAELSTDNQHQLPAIGVGLLGCAAQFSLQMTPTPVATIWESPKENRPAELQQSAKPWEVIINCCFKFLGFEMVCYGEKITETAANIVQL